MQVVQTPTPRRFEYAGDLASGSPQAAAAYARQVSSGTPDCLFLLISVVNRKLVRNRMQMVLPCCLRNIELQSG